MWDEIQIQCSDVSEIAEALINGEVALKQLMAVASFAAKKELTEEAVWDYCKNKGLYKRYIELYPNGKFVGQVEESVWNGAVKSGNVDGFLNYRTLYPQGVHAAEVEENIWSIAIAHDKIDDYRAYLQYFPNGIHVDDADESVWGSFFTSNNYEGYLKVFPNGIHSDEARVALEKKEAEEEKWNEACQYDVVESYKTYLDLYPKGIHSVEANRRIKEIGIEQKESIINALIEDRNAYPLAYIKSCGITAADLKGKITDSQGQIRDEIFKSWDKPVKALQMGKTPSEIPSGSTEVYFWGIPGSGKTCAMAAILSQARRMGIFEPREGPGLPYMNDLSTMFLAEPTRPAVTLPDRSSVEATQYLPLTLNETIEAKNGKQTIKQHNLDIIEISGEIFECFSREIEGKPFKSREHKETYEQLKNYLSSVDNPKYHFFILDSKPLNDADQMTYLQNAVLYFKNREVFNKTTQGISLIVTKSDELSPRKDEWVRCAETVAKEYFGSLVTQLKRIVGKDGLQLSDGRLNVIPLSIGDVFFNRLCLFDPEPATTLVNKLIEYSKVYDTPNWMEKLKKGLKS